jgi:calcium permeable stress-gated cation channel
MIPLISYGYYLHQRRRRGRRAMNPAYANSSLAPTSFVAPSQYYKLRNVQGVSDGRFSDFEPLQSNFSDSVNSRVVGSRFQEVNRNSVAYGRLPLGSHVRLDNTGELKPSTPTGTSTPPDFSRGPNYSIEETDEFNNRRRAKEGSGEDAGIEDESDWVDVMREAPIIFSDESEQPSGSGVVSSGTAVESPLIPPARPRPDREQEYSDSRRETFPLRPKAPASNESSGVIPPHLRLQPQQPFVRPLSGVDHDNLGDVYTQIREWRTKLKQINADINDLQQQAYIDIADGTNIKGWLMVGRGVRFVPGVVMIEGRSKEDIRWDVLQHERTVWDSAAMWTLVVLMAVILLAIRK